ncbi:Response regulator receiver domain-containing protein [Ekhidna lutea]|uniref:Response regulator receiver domain-containing protein n=1 Tax=Ekhidna lutea TaxID=447679 RepID=A0A239H2C4_EKHLU|nr:response regulator [Ekhidna lutea]SNS74404.1 Response regulator receiver domain-containing protein [Ekhidna lutea]
MKKRIVLIDDDKQTNFLNKLTIERSNVVDEVVIFSSPLEALDYLNKRPDEEKGSLILLDINMPVMDGWEFLRLYATKNQNKAVDKVVMLTSSIDPRDQKLAEENVLVSDLKFKPLSLRMINEIVKLLLK